MRQPRRQARERLRQFAHFGFRRVDLVYQQPPLGVGKEPVDYLDLLFAPWEPRILQRDRLPASLVLDTVWPIWSAWTSDAAGYLGTARDQIAADQIALSPLVFS